MNGSVNESAINWLDEQYEAVIAAGERFQRGMDDEADRLLLQRTTWSPPGPSAPRGFFPH